MITPPNKAQLFADTVDEWRRHYTTESRRVTLYRDAKDFDAEQVLSEAIERKRVAIGCMAASLLLHDRALFEQESARAKVRDDFEKAGMILPGHRLVFIGASNRPVCVPINFTPQA